MSNVIISRLKKKKNINKRFYRIEKKKYMKN